MKINLYSFFSGAGFLDLGFEHEGYHVDYVNELHSPFLDAYKYTRQQLKIEKPTYGYFSESITELLDRYKCHLQDLVSASRRGTDLVGFIGGPPCPDFSIGGKNKGRHGDNGQLSEAYIETILYQNPDFFLFENVKGLWRTAKHKAFYEEMKTKLRKADYMLTDRLINSIEYGVPQDRDRIILIGFKKSILRDIGFKEKKESILGEVFPWKSNLLYSKDDIFALDWPDVSPFVENSKTAFPTGLQLDLTVEYWFNRNKVYGHPNSKHHFQPRAALSKFCSIAEGDVAGKSFKRLHRWRYSPTAAYGNNEVHIHPYLPRRISIAEALAIQSLPADFILPPDMTLSNMFKTVGNGVPYLAARGIAKTLRSFLEGIENEQINSSRSRKSNQATSVEYAIGVS